MFVITENIMKRPVLQRAQWFVSVVPYYTKFRGCSWYDEH